MGLFFYLKRIFNRLIIVFFCLINFSFSPVYSIGLDYIFELSAGLNFSTIDIPAVSEQYNLAGVERDIAPSFHLRNGVVLFDSLLLFLGYSFFQKEQFNYKTSYFIPDESSVLEKSYHSLQVFSGYSFFPYTSKNNLSLSLGGGWIRKIEELRTIKFRSNFSNLNNVPIAIPLQASYDEGILTTNLKFYHRLRRESTLFLSIEYSLLLPSLEHFPNLVLGIDLNLEIIPQPKKIDLNKVDLDKNDVDQFGEADK